MNDAMKCVIHVEIRHVNYGGHGRHGYTGLQPSLAVNGISRGF